MSVSTTTYTIRLCKTGKEFKCIPNVADDCRPRPAMGKVKGLISSVNLSQQDHATLFDLETGIESRLASCQTA